MASEAEQQEHLEYLAYKCSELTARGWDIDPFEWLVTWRSIVRASLLNQSGEPGTFHLKHKGITLIAQGVEKKDDDTYLVSFEEGLHGILNGGHSHELITKAGEEVPRTSS